MNEWLYFKKVPIERLSEISPHLEELKALSVFTHACITHLYLKKWAYKPSNTQLELL